MRLLVILFWAALTIVQAYYAYQFKATQDQHEALIIGTIEAVQNVEWRLQIMESTMMNLDERVQAIGAARR